MHFQGGGEVLFLLVEGVLLGGEAGAQLFALLLVGGRSGFGFLAGEAGVVCGGFSSGNGLLLAGFFGVGVAVCEECLAGGEGLGVRVLQGSVLFGVHGGVVRFFGG